MSYDFSGLASLLVSHSSSFLPSLLPGGKQRGSEYVCANIGGGPGDSLSVNTRTGKWADFASDLKGGDLISLYAAVHGVSQGDAAKQLAKDYNFQLSSGSNGAAKNVKLCVAPAGTQLPSLTHIRHGNAAESWKYLDNDLNIRFIIARYNTPSGKQIIPWSYTEEGQWICKGWKPLRPLYGFEQLSRRPDAPILIVEGEKAADAAKALCGHVYLIITWPNGSKAVNKADWRPIFGRDKVLLWPDNDEPGRQAMQEVGAQLFERVGEIKLLDPYEFEHGWDAADAVRSGWKWDDFFKWAKSNNSLYEPVLCPQPEPPEPLIEKPQGVQNNLTLNIITGDLDPTPPSMMSLWEKLNLSVTGQGVPISNYENVVRVLGGCEVYRSIIWYDSFLPKDIHHLAHGRTTGVVGCGRYGAYARAANTRGVKTDDKDCGFRCCANVRR